LASAQSKLILTTQVFGLFSFLKPSGNIPRPYEAQVFITNILSFIFFWLTVGIALIFYFLFGRIATLPYISLIAFSFLMIPLINRWVSHQVGRTLFCLIPVWITMISTVYFKRIGASDSDILYFGSRFILMATPILPGIVFRLEERLHLSICMGSSAVCMLLYDPIHQLAGVGYYQRGFTDPSYYYISYISGSAFVVLVVGILLLRSMMEKTEYNLELQNRELHQKQHEVEAYHEELLQHQEEMASGSEKLEEANAVIMQQQTTLQKYNARLEALVSKKSQELRRANEELIKHNNELIQFSYTVSHNLRGPVARLLGLSRLFQVTEQKDEKKHLESLIVRSTEELDGILKDLSLIIDIRNEIYSVREKVFLEEEWKKAMSFLEDNIRPEYVFETNFTEAPYVFGVRPMVQSILYNLLSNAIKYKSPDRPLKVIVKAHAMSGVKTVIELEDNGLGIDLKNQEKDVFKLYKRFHSHIAGKGLGLYLVKTQVEALGGKISVQSELHKGTVFKIIFTQPDEVTKQIFHESDAVQLYYDGNLKVTVIQWKRPVSSEEYRETFKVVLDSLKIYKTPGWVSDVRKQGVVSAEDQQWLVQTVGTEALRNGLKRIAVIGFKDPLRTDYYERIKIATSENGADMKIFNSMEEALEWMQSYETAS
jgi:signal transduction histidine kinase